MFFQGARQHRALLGKQEGALAALAHQHVVVDQLVDGLAHRHAVHVEHGGELVLVGNLGRPA